MKQNLKALGLALVAAFALSAVAASAAWAEVEFHSEQANTTLTVSSSSEQVFSSGAFSFPCSHVTIDTTVAVQNTNDISVTPSFATTTTETEECKIVSPQLGTFKLHVDVNSCFFTFTSSPGALHIKCATPGDSITVTQTILGQSVACIHIPEQTPTEQAVDYKNEGSGNTRAILLTSTVQGITYTLTKGCVINGVEINKVEKEANDASYSGEATIIGEDAGGNRVGIWVE